MFLIYLFFYQLVFIASMKQHKCVVPSLFIDFTSLLLFEIIVLGGYYLYFEYYKDPSFLR